MERGSDADIRPVSARGVPHFRHRVPNERLRVAVPDQDRDEARRHQNGEVGETDDQNRDIFGTVHVAGVSGYVEFK